MSGKGLNNVLKSGIQIVKGRNLDYHSKKKKSGIGIQTVEGRNLSINRNEWKDRTNKAGSNRQDKASMMLC